MTCTAALAPTPADSLRALYRHRSKHSDYQRLHPLLRELVGTGPDAGAGKHEAQRAALLRQHLPLQGARVLDIGANTGYFAFDALAAGAAHVTCVEGNAQHAQFLREAAAALGWSRRLEVQQRYFAFEDDPLAGPFDVGLCLNVLHHLGDDFGDPALAMDEARERMAAGVRSLAERVAVLALQIGFNWKGQRQLGLFPGGEKAALVDFVQRAAREAWALQSCHVASTVEGPFVALDASTLPRNDALGEFLNRPLFVLASRRLAAR